MTDAHDITDQLPAEIAPARVSRLLAAAEFHRLADVPPEVEWFANLTILYTRRSYENAIRDLMGFTGIGRPEEFRTVTRAHIIARRDELARRGLGGSTIRHRLALLASLVEYLCDKNAVTHNPFKGVERPRTESGEGKTPALGNHQAREGQRPALAVASFISVGEMQVGDPDLAGLAVNVLPVDVGTTIAVLSYARAMAGKVRSSLDRILISSGHHQKL